MSPTEYYDIETLLATFTKYNPRLPDTMQIRKRTILNRAPIGGMGSVQLLLLIFSLPFIEFAVIFNPIVFGTLGIAQAVVAYIVLMSLIMFLGGALLWRNNRKVISMITPSWDRLFPGIDLGLVLSSGHTPYKDFYTRCSQLVAEGKRGSGLQQALKQSFEQMNAEHPELLQALERGKR